jgi:hypothetical protein
MFRSLHHSGAGRLWLLFSGAVFRPWCLVAVVGLAWPGGPMASGGADSTALGGLACGGNDRAGGRGAGFHCHPAAGGLWVRIPLSRPLTWPASLDERRASSSSRCGRPMRSGTLSSRVTTIRLLGGAARVRLAGPARPVLLCQGRDRDAKFTSARASPSGVHSAEVVDLLAAGVKERPRHPTAEQAGSHKVASEHAPQTGTSLA